LSEILAKVLLAINSLLNNYGVSILLLTLLTRVILLPLTIKQTSSMRQMQRLQPELKKIQQKHKNDKQKQNEAILKFYQENRFNPLSGCLPLLLQMPIFFALFRMLTFVPSSKADLLSYPSLAKIHASLTKLPYLGIKGFLAKPAWPTIKPLFSGQFQTAFLVFLVFVALMIISQWWMQKTMSAQDAQQQRIMGFMTIFLAYIGFVLPMGVLVYWITTNFATVGQHIATVKYLEKQEAENK